MIRNDEHGNSYAEASINSTEHNSLQFLERANLDSPSHNGPQFGIPTDFNFHTFDSPYLGREWPQYGEEQSHDWRAAPRGQGSFGRQTNPRSRDSPRGSWRRKERSDGPYHNYREMDNARRTPRQSHKNAARLFPRDRPHFDVHPHFYGDFGTDRYPPSPFGFYHPGSRPDHW